VPNPELILRRGRSFQGQTSKLGTQINLLSHSKKSIEEKIGSSSSKIVSEKAFVTTAEESIISYQEENVITKEVIGSNLVEESSKKFRKKSHLIIP
jgi:hypothetical protein